MLGGSGGWNGRSALVVDSPWMASIPTQTPQLHGGTPNGIESNHRIYIKHPECMTGDAPKLRQDRGTGRRATHRRDVRNVFCTATGSIGTSGTSVAAGIIKQGLSSLR